ncbi:hypothetical protein [Chloroflexus sp. Y-396-1]|nr:hypothetical protein [Chloroflexus sp. Y-396-1]
MVALGDYVTVVQQVTEASAWAQREVATCVEAEAQARREAAARA